jgi:hypothetical protein
MPDWLIELTGKQPPKRLTIRERATAAVNAHRVMRMVRSGGAGAYAAPHSLTKSIALPVPVQAVATMHLINRLSVCFS